MDKPVNATTLEVHDFGCVNYMALPYMWMAPPSFKNDFAPIEVMTFVCPKNLEGKISLIKVNRRLQTAAKDNLLALLKETPHVLLPREIRSIAGVLRGAESLENFRPLQIGTQLWNGKMALVLTGRWLEDETIFWLIVECNGELQEILYSAPSHAYSQQIVSTLKSVRWADN